MYEYFEEILLKNDQIYVVGAQSRAKAVAGYVKGLFPNVVITAFLVDDSEKNETNIQGIPVYALDKHLKFDISNPVFIATKGLYHSEIQQSLHRLGFRTIVPVTYHIDTWFRNKYVEKIFQQDRKSFERIDQLVMQEGNNQKESELKGCIYMARSIYDKPLRKVYVCPSYERPIQVGAALTSQRLDPEMLIDCDGDNISLKNRQYCELTGLYWIWKHCKEDIIGLSHYRRHFILPENWIRLMEYFHIDVILPVPAYIAPNIEDNYKERHDAADWDYLMQYLKRSSLSDYELAKRVFAGNLYLTCNMLIARKTVLNQLCEWLFPIVDAVTQHGGEKEDTYDNRYPGFVSERLFTLFFEKNQNRFKIVYADKRFIS